MLDDESSIHRIEQKKSRRVPAVVPTDAELIAEARQVHVPGMVEVDVLCRRLADELEARS